MIVTGQAGSELDGWLLMWPEGYAGPNDYVVMCLWLPPGWIGHYTLGFSWMREHIIKIITNTAKLPNLKQQWTWSMFHWYDHLEYIFIPSLGLEDVAWHMEALNKFTKP